MTRQGTQSELNDLIRSRTELTCTIEDLRLAVDRSSGQSEQLRTELENVEARITEREQELRDLLPQWDTHRARENEEKKRLDEARIRLDGLYAKRGRLEKFRTRAERDRYLRAEIASVENHSRGQAAALENTRQELDQARAALAEVEQRAENAVDRAEDGRRRAKELGEQLAQLKDEQAELSERRKELWREETKLKSLVDNEKDELRAAERLLASMMDKVRSFLSSLPAFEF